MSKTIVDNASISPTDSPYLMARRLNVLITEVDSTFM